MEALVDQVLAIDSSHSRADILLDLKFTKCVETTVNRIFDGQFLKGVQRGTKEATIILDSDEEEEVELKHNNSYQFDSVDSFPDSQKKESIKDNGSQPLFPEDSFEMLSPNLPVSPIRYDDVEAKPSTPVINLDLDSLSQSPPTSPIPNIPSTRREATPPPPIISLDSLEDLSRSPPKSPLNTFDDEPFSYQTTSNSKKRKASEPSSLLIESDSDGSLPSVSDFLDKLISRKKTDRKGKQRAYEYDIPKSNPISDTSTMISDSESNRWSLSAKEKKQLETEERKRLQAEEKQRLLEEKTQKKLELQEQKKQAKEQKLLEKQRATILERENRIKNDRVETIKEMIVDIHPDFLKTTTGALVKLILEKKETALKMLPSSSKYHISWRRICKSEWDPIEMIFVPFDKPKIIQEPFALIYIDVYEFVKYIQQDTIDEYIDNLKNGSRQIFLLVEGLQAYYKKKINYQRRLFDEQVRSTIEGSTSSRRKNQPELENGPSQLIVESCIDRLILEKGVRFITTKKDEDSASWIESLTTDLALGRYKSKNVNNSYKVNKCGTDPSDTFSKLLQEIQLCTPAVAKSVMQAYPTLYSLKKAHESKPLTEAELLLADLDVERSTFTARDRKINRVMSKKIYKIFNSTDPDQLIN